MPIICRLLQISRESAELLIAEPTHLADAVDTARIYSDVYRYWDGIGYLLARHAPASLAATWLSLGQAVSTATEAIPAARVFLPGIVAQLDQTLREIEPDALAPHYDAAALDGAGIYPRTWVEWEETFDPLGQLLEHYSFLQYSIKGCASDGAAQLMYFVDDGEDC